jgi:hypothetical protein
MPAVPLSLCCHRHVKAATAAITASVSNIGLYSLLTLAQSRGRFSSFSSTPIQRIFLKAGGRLARAHAGRLWYVGIRCILMRRNTAAQQYLNVCYESLVAISWCLYVLCLLARKGLALKAYSAVTIQYLNISHYHEPAPLGLPRCSSSKR